MRIEMRKLALFSFLVMGSMALFAQGAPKAKDCVNKWGADSVETQKQLSMFNQYYQEKKYVEAYPYWEYLFTNAPCVQKRVTYAGPYIVKQRIKMVSTARKAESADQKAKLKELKKGKVDAAAAANAAGGKPNYAALKAAYEESKKTYDDFKVADKAIRKAYSERLRGLADTVFMSYAKRIELHGKEGYVKGKWANDICKLTPANRLEGLAMFEESLKLQGNATGYKVPKDYIYAGVKGYKMKQLSLDSLFLILDAVTPIIDFNLAKYTAEGVTGKDSLTGAKWIKTQEAVIGMMKPYLNCDKIVELKEPGYEAHKEDAAWLKATIKLLSRGGCEKEDFYLQCSEQLFSMEPSSDAAFALAKAFGKKDQDAKAISYYVKAADLATDDQSKVNIYIRLAKSSKNARQYSKVREWARKALAIDANSGVAYILIGDAYYASAGSCGSGDLGAGGVYLVAADKYSKAKSVDASVAATASEKLSKAASRFPDKETAFFKGINNGDSYRVGCWIGESTSVRTTGG